MPQTGFCLNIHLKQHINHPQIKALSTSIILIRLMEKESEPYKLQKRNGSHENMACQQLHELTITLNA